MASIPLSILLTLSALLSPAAPNRAEGAQSTSSTSPRKPEGSFEDLSRRAKEALTSGRSAEALGLYRAGVELDAQWADGWWRLGVLYFDEERFADSSDALARLVSLERDSALAWALLGLSQYRLQQYDRALASLRTAIDLRVPDQEPIGREAVHYFTLLLIRSGDFRGAPAHLTRLVHLEPDDPELIAACGLMALRIQRLPSETPPADMELVMMAGRAAYSAFGLRGEEARKRFDELIARYPRTRGVHYAYGLFLSREASDQALPILRKEVELFPDHVGAQLQLAFEILDRGTATEALVPSQAAVRLAPDSYVSRLALGRALVATGASEEGIAELERAARLSPDISEIYVAMAQAYASVGRVKDVERARARLIELTAKLEAGPR